MASEQLLFGASRPSATAAGEPRDAEDCLLRVNEAAERAVRNDGPDVRVAVFIEGLGRSLCADRSYVFEVNARGMYDNTYEWCAEGVAPQRDRLQDISESEFASDWWEAFRAGGQYLVSDMAAYRAHDPRMADLLASQNIDALIVSPILIKGELRGFLGLDNPCPAALSHFRVHLQMAALFVANELDRRDHAFGVPALTRFDHMTGLLNLAGMSCAVDAAIRAAREGAAVRAMAVVYLDISDFKSFNRSYGYGAGDRLLVHMADLLNETAGRDHACHGDADRFYALVENDRAEAFVDDIHRRMKDDPTRSAHVIGGIYAIDGTESSTSQVLDRAKIAGGAVSRDFTHCWRRYASRMEDRLALENYVSTHAAEAAARGWLTVYYQPMIGTFSERVECFEALVRWDDPFYGMLAPAQFVDVLERTHQAHLVDLYVLDRVCATIADKVRAGEPFVPVSVNLSRYDLELPDIHDRIDGILEAHRVPHSAVRFEITETALVENEDHIAEHLAAFHARGYEVWLDDFGSGYSSLNTLQRFDFDCVKLDILFLRSESVKSRTLVGDLIDMAKHLGLKTLAEGVETDDQFGFLKSIGCALAQGYWCARPQPLAAVEETLARKGISLINPLERLVFDDIARVDVRGSYIAATHAGTAIAAGEAVAVFTEHAGTLALVFADEGFAARLRIAYPEGAPREWSGRQENSFFVWRLRSWFHALDATGVSRDFVVAKDGVETTVRVKLVSDHLWGRAYLAEARSVRLGEDEAASEDLFNMVSPLIEEMSVVDLSADRVSIAYSAFGVDGRARGDMVYSDELRRFARERIYPLDNEGYRAFLDPGTMASRVDRAPRGLLNGYFRVLTDASTYELRRITVSRVPSTGPSSRFLICVMTDAAGWTQDLIEESRGIDGAGDGAFSPDELWAATLSSTVMGVFWKDADRRFRGANRAFLQYFDVAPDEIVGKTDEDMGWHPDPRPFKDDEALVLSTGAIVSNAVGTCVVDGSERAIIAAESPVFRGGRIVGLVGRCYDAGDLVEAIRASDARVLAPLQARALVDDVTGLPNAEGMLRRFHELHPDARVDEDFGFLAVQVLGTLSIQRYYGSEVYDSLQRAIARALEGAVPDGVVARSYESRYAIMIRPCDADRLRKLRAAVARALEDITQVEGVPCTVYALVGAALYSDGIDFGEMTARAELSFAPARTAASAERPARPAELPNEDAPDGADAGLRARLDQLRRENEALRRESRIDELTRVLNRRGFDEMVASLFENGAHGVVVLAADIDDFKLFNDRFGHGVGDALLESLAGELRGLFGDEYLSRFGGDEFQAILVDPDDAMMARMRDFFFRPHAVELRGRTYTYRCCAGYARRSEDQEGFSELCRRADMALYHAKLARGGAFEFEAAMRGDRRSQLGFSLRDISNGLPAAVFAYRDDPTEEILFANRHCVELFGCSSYDELLDLCDGSFRGMMDPSQRDRVEASIRSQIEDGAGSDRDFAAYDIVRADGQRVRVLDAGRLVDNEYYGRVFFVLLINAELVEEWEE